ncbi:MAG: VWA domain-containing protein, partial [Acidobacteriota bacterium]|nr:VWA domain-containing protein [Acidobacteriota bacterium]
MKVPASRHELEKHDHRMEGWQAHLAPALLAAVILGGWPVGAQDEPPPVFVERVDVDVVNIEVFVFDKQGNRLTGLSQEDFEILEDGKPVEISNFYAVARRERLERTLETGRLPEESMPSEDLQLLPTDRQLNLAVYVDNFNLRGSSRNRVLDDLEVFLEDRIRLGDNVMLIEALRGAEVVQPFTRDWMSIAEGLREMRKSATYRQQDESAIRRNIRSMILAAGQESPRRAHDIVRSYVEQAKGDLRRSAATLRDTVRSLAGLPGRKALLYVSEGLPQRPGEELYQQLDAIFSDLALSTARSPGGVIDPSLEAVNEDESGLFNDIVREANAHQVTFYTLDASGSGGMSGLSAASGGTDIAGFGGRVAFDNLRKQNLQQPLIEMAEGTGGTSILDSFNFGSVLDRLADDFDSFYSLGYSPEGNGASRYRDIEVRVKSPGFEVRHRTGYLHKAPEERIADRTLSSLYADLEKNPLAVEIDFGDWEKMGRNQFNLPILVRVPLSQITLLPSGDSHEGRLRIYVAVKDEEGAISDVHEQVYPV